MIRNVVVTLWDNPLMAQRDSGYNCVRNVSVLGKGRQFNDYTTRNAALETILIVNMPDTRDATRFTYARVDNILYYITAVEVTHSVAHFSLMIDPISTYINSMQVSGITTHVHINNSNPLADVYEHFYANEFSFNRISSFTNNSRVLLAPAFRVVLSNTDVPRVNKNHQLGTPLPIFAGSATFGINTIPPLGGVKLSMHNTGVFNALKIQRNIEALTRLNAVNSILEVYQIPVNPSQNLALPVQTHTHYVANSYSGSNVAINRLYSTTLVSHSTGEEITVNGWEFASDTVSWHVSGLLTPQGNAFAYFNANSLSGLTRLNNVPILERSVHSTPWKTGDLITTQPMGEAFALQQTTLQRQQNSLNYAQQNRNATLNDRQQQVDAIRTHINSVISLVSTLGDLGNIAGFITGVANVAQIGINNTTQIAINRDRLAENRRQIGENFNQTARAIDMQEHIRRTVAPTQISRNNNNLGVSPQVKGFAVRMQQPTQNMLNVMDRYINAYGYNAKIYVNELSAIRANHSFYRFESVSVNIPTDRSLSVLAEIMLMTGVRIWETTPTVAGVYNNN